ncbi:MAG: hypothetical protein E6H05_06475 [Bacillati bacterium ANGP1]|uniref:Putative regulatory protein FmdB zinc ribbon domain-containing protein n=1 Tax=Candidatus Segetimicrobium genomatis TaxID=2569760 RepID=A0A537IXW6_9BACT|nr:MAG: hypothetical protein E6H05_06475 [Terrabacteria group bacterium ANGP1]
MPLYEYRCTRCDHLFEVHHEVGGTPGPCPVCGGPARRVFSSVGLIFKGSGFYTTDHRKPSSSDGADKKGAETKSTEKKSPEKMSPTGASPPDAPSKDASPKPSS